MTRAEVELELVKLDDDVSHSRQLVVVGNELIELSAIVVRGSTRTKHRLFNWTIILKY